jgi:predicted nucleic acid-binding protein
VPGELYALDTNVYVRALRERDRLVRLKRFLIRTGNRLRVNATVALELRAGARTLAQEQAIADLLAAYADRERVMVPSFDAYLQGGRVLASLAAHERVDIARAGSLVNDVMVATSCREHGVRLVTENARDFTTIQRYVRGFRFAAADEVLAG